MSPRLHAEHRPHAMLKGTEQMSPISSISQSSPSSTTSPVISWPSTMCPPGSDVRPRTMCWSLPQMFVVTTCSAAWAG